MDDFENGCFQYLHHIYMHVKTHIPNILIILYYNILLSIGSRHLNTIQNSYIFFSLAESEKIEVILTYIQLFEFDLFTLSIEFLFL